MKKIILFLFFSTQFLCAQKIVKKTVLNPDIKAVEIDAKNCFEINMKTAETDELLVLATIDGEYKQDLILNLKEEGSNIFVSAGFSQNFKNPNDKLSAHKVVSIALEIIVPELQKVQISGSSCNVSATGVYEDLKITLDDGICTLKDISEKIMVTTQSGDINVESKNAQIKAASKFGNVQKNEIPKGDNYFILNSTVGDINLVRNE